jgi:two-component sensor histidine kinase
MLFVKKNPDVQSIINEATKLAMAQEYFEKPALTISYKNTGTSRVLLVRDNGDGFSKSVLENIEQNSGMGLELIQLLAEQIDAKCKFYTDNGACVEITF